MSFAHFLLRLGCTLVGWLVVYTYGLVLVTLPVAKCLAGADDPWRASFVLALLSAPFAFLIPLGRELPGAVSTLRWFALPLLVLAPVGVWVVLPFLLGSTLGSAHFCQVQTGQPGPVSPAWHAAWAPVQLVVIAGICWAGLSYWRAPVRSPK